MPGVTRRSLALAAASASLLVPLGAGASPAPAQLPCVAVLDAEQVRTLAAVPGADVQALLGQACLDTPAELADLLTGANSAERRALLGGLTADQSAAALRELHTGGGDLQGVVAVLAPTQIRALAGDAGALAAVVEGLRRTVAGLAGTAPAPAAVDQVLAQAAAVLAGALPQDTTALNDLLGRLVELLGTSGLDTSGLRALRDTLASSPAALLPGGGYLLAVLNGLLSPAGGSGGSGGGSGGSGGGPGGSGGGSGGSGGSGGGSGGPGGAGGPGSNPAAYRARIARLSVSRARRTVRVVLRCPSGAPGCTVALTGRAAGRSIGDVEWAGLLPGTSEAIRVRLPRRVTRRLRARGGRVSVRAVTVGSSRPPATRSVRVRRARTRG